MFAASSTVHVQSLDPHIAFQLRVTTMLLRPLLLLSLLLGTEIAAHGPTCDSRLGVFFDGRYEHCWVAFNTLFRPFTVTQTTSEGPLRETSGNCLVQVSIATHKTTFDPQWARRKMAALIRDCVQKELLGGEYLVDGFTFRAVHLGFVSPELSFIFRRPLIHAPTSTRSSASRPA